MKNLTTPTHNFSQIHKPVYHFAPKKQEKTPPWFNPHNECGGFRFGHHVIGVIAGVWGVCFGRPSQEYDIYVKAVKSDIDSSLFIIGAKAGYVGSRISLFTNDL